MPTPKRVRCLDNTDAIGFLKIGQIYEVVKEQNICGDPHYELSGVAMNWLQSRFEVVPDSAPPPNAPTQPSLTADNYTCTRPQCGNTKLCTTTDKVCWKCGEPVKP